MNLVRYVLGSVRVDEGVPALLPVDVGGADVGDHDGVAVAVESVLEEPEGIELLLFHKVSGIVCLVPCLYYAHNDRQRNCPGGTRPTNSNI